MRSAATWLPYRQQNEKCKQHSQVPASAPRRALRARTTRPIEQSELCGMQRRAKASGYLYGDFVVGSSIYSVQK